MTLDINPQRIAHHGKELQSVIFPALEKGGEISGQWQGGDVYKKQHECTNDGLGKSGQHKAETAVGDSELPPWDLV